MKKIITINIPMARKSKEIPEDSPLREIKVMEKDNGAQCVVFHGIFATEMLIGTGIELGSTYRFHKDGEPTDYTMTMVGISDGHSGIHSGKNNHEKMESFMKGIKDKPANSTLWAHHNGNPKIEVVDYLTKFSFQKDGSIKYSRHGSLIKEENHNGDTAADTVSQILSS